MQTAEGVSGLGTRVNYEFDSFGDKEYFLTHECVELRLANRDSRGVYDALEYRTYEQVWYMNMAEYSKKANYCAQCGDRLDR